MSNSGKLDLKSYLDAYDDSNVWVAPMLIILLASLLHAFKNSDVLDGGAVELSYDMTVLDESGSSCFEPLW